MLTLHMLVRDEEELLPVLLEHVRPYVSEMAIVIDNATTDRTAEIVAQYTKRYVPVALNMDYSAARNIGLAMVTTPWVLHLDADEWPTTELLDYIRVFLGTRKAIQCSGLLIRRHNLVNGQPIGTMAEEKHVRVFQSHYRFQGRIHEAIVLPQRYVLQVPTRLYIQHYKMQGRQERLNQHYEQWPEQQALRRE